MSSTSGEGESPLDDLTAADELPAVVPEPKRLPAHGVSAVPGAGRAPVAEDPGLLSANLNVGVRLFASAVTFVFVSFLFAFFYLDAVNSNGLFKPRGVNPSAAYGIVMLVCVLGSVAAFSFARRSLLAEEPGGWLGGLWASLALGLVVVVLQILQYTNFGFSPESGGYASVFVGWTAMFLLFWLGALYWVETFLAGTLRGPPAEAESEITRPVEVLRPSANACLVYLLTMAGVEFVTWILLYLVK
jgi:heme/copper-type cytochrome/quinol oxidase subunit 3